jgi:ceramide glucosyltransferase
MQWEAVAVNADFWSQVLQSRTLKPLDFALGAVMATRRPQLNEIGGFRALVDYLADDYQLGNQIAKRGYRIELCPVVVECWERPQGWREVWAHQLRWARTIRVCQPVPYFFSILSNATVWNFAAAISAAIYIRTHSPNGLLEGDFTTFETALLAVSCGLISIVSVVRISIGFECEFKLAKRAPSQFQLLNPLLKDLLQVPIWALAFLGNTVVWRGQRLRVLPGGKLVPVSASQ